MNYRSTPVILWSSMMAAAALSGCGHNQASPAAPELPVIPVSEPVQREVTDFVDYTGRTAAVNALDVRPRVSGYLTRIPFKEGAEVKRGDLLFEIDPRPYQIQLDQAKATVNLNEASLRLARATYARDRQIASREPGGVSAQQLDQDQAQVLQAEASLKASQATVNSAQLYLDWTRVTSPIDGQVSRYYLTLGNLVVADQTLLTTIMSVDPMYAYFDVDERTVLRIRTAINEGKIIPPKDAENIPVLMGLEGEEGYPHHGTVNFVNNQVNPSTGTIAVRGVFANPKPPNGRRLLSPGMFVRIRLPIGQPHPALLVIDRAVGSDQGLKFLYVLDKDNKVQYRRVQIGALQDDGLRVIEQGLSPDDRVVIGGLQQVRPRVQVEPEPMSMPSLAQPAEGTPPPPPAQSGKPQPPPPAGKSETRSSKSETNPKPEARNLKR